MSDRFHDYKNDKVHAPSGLFDFFEHLGKGKRVKKGKYKNLDEFIEQCISIFATTFGKNSFKERLEFEDDESYVDFSLEPEFYKLPYRLTFKISRKESDDGECLYFSWFPFNKTIYLDGLLYDGKLEKKIIANKECDVKNIPDKAGEDIGKKLGVDRILLVDESTIFMEGGLRISLAMFYLKKNGTTYYGKFGYKPIKLSNYNANVLNDIMFNLPTESASTELKFIKDQLKKTGDMDLISTIKKFQDLGYYFPQYYEKKL